MKGSKNIFYFFIMVFLITMIYASVPQNVYALSSACYDSTGAPIPCSDTGGGSKPGPKNRPTPVTTIPTSVPKLLALPTAPVVPALIPAGGAGLNNPNSELPAIQDPGQGSSPSNLPGLLGSIIAVILILGGLFFGLLLPAIQKRSSDDGSDKMGAQPHMNEGADQFLKFEGNPSSQVNGVSDQFLKFEGPATEMPPESPVKPPSPNIGNKSGGGTL